MPGPLEPLGDQPTAAEMYEQTAQPRRFGKDPRRRDVIDVPLDAGQRAVIKEALAFWHDSGPRSRNCREAQLAMLRIDAAAEAAAQLELAAGPGWEPSPPIDAQLPGVTGRHHPLDIIDAEIVEDP